jgi:hypothetical protein
MTNSSFLEKRAESLEQKGGKKSVKNVIHFWASLATPNMGLPLSSLIRKGPLESQTMIQLQ